MEDLRVEEQSIEKIEITITAIDKEHQEWWIVNREQVYVLNWTDVVVDIEPVNGDITVSTSWVNTRLLTVTWHKQVVLWEWVWQVNIRIQGEEEKESREEEIDIVYIVRRKVRTDQGQEMILTRRIQVVKEEVNIRWVSIVRKLGWWVKEWEKKKSRIVLEG